MRSAKYTQLSTPARGPGCGRPAEPLVTEYGAATGGGSVEQLGLRHRLRGARPAQQFSEPLLPLLHVEVMLVLQRAAQDRRELVEGGEQFRDRLAQRLRLEPGFARAHVLEDRLLAAGGDDRLGATRDKHVGAALRAAVLLDRHQADDGIRTPVLAVPEKDHPIALDFHGASGPSPAVGRPRFARRQPEERQQTPDRAQRCRRLRMSSSATVSILPSIRTRTSSFSQYMKL